MHELGRDLRFALRGLARQPGFAAIAILTLAVGVGANTAMFGALSAVLLSPLPYDDPGRLVIANTTFEGNPNWTSSAQDYEDYRRQARSFSSLGLMSGFPLSVAATGTVEPEMVETQLVSWDLFEVLRVEPALGRAFQASDSELGGAEVALLSHDYWQSALGGIPDVVGQSLGLDGSPTTIVGVMPEGFRFYFDVDVWVPYRLGGSFAGGRQFHNWVPIGRLEEGVSLEQAQSEVDTIAARLRESYPDTNENKGLRLVGLHASMTQGARPSMMMLGVAVLLLLFIACANVANLLLVRGSARRRELAVRSALGAARGRLVRQLLTESLLIALLAGLVGVGLALGLQRGVLDLVVAPALGEPTLGLSWPTLAFALAASLATSLLFGSVPALRSAPRHLASRLRSGARGGAARSRLPGGLVVFQVALSLVLLVGAGLLLRSFTTLLAVDVGFEPDDLLTAEIRLPAGEYGAEERVGFFARLEEEVAALPGVTSVGVISQLPVRDPGNNIYVYDARHPPADLSGTLTANTRIVRPGYLETMRIPLLRGRGILSIDTEDSPPVMVINRTMAETLFAGESPLGQRVVIAGNPNAYEVVGVVGDVRMSGPAAGPRMSMYRSHAQVPEATMRVAIRLTTDPAGVASAVRGIVRELDPELPVAELRTMRSVIAESGALVQTRVAARSLAVFALVALILATVGLYGVLARFVEQRHQEIGVRLALGDDGGGVTRLVLGRGLRLVSVGIVLGTIGALLATRLLGDLLFEVAGTDPATYVAVTALFLVVGGLACAVPVRRALRVSPLASLRAD